MDDKLVRLSHAISAAKTGADDWDGGCNIERDRYIEKAFADIPAVDAVEVRHGKFIHDGPKFDGGVDWYHCSVCLAPETGVYVSRPYCSWCGARMDGRREDGEA